MRILRYLLGHKIALFVVIVLLVGQAFADLSLPKLTSDIVDVGIQQSGIEHAACDEVSARTHDIAVMMSDAAGEELLAASYDKTESGAYRLNDFGEQRIDELDEVMALPLIVAHVDGVLPEGLTIDGALAAYQTGSVTKEQIDGAVGALEETMSVAGDSLVEQQAIAAARSEYEALGYDLTSVQMTYLVTVGVKMLALAGLSMVLSVLVASRTGARIGYDLRKALFSKVVSFSEAEIGAFSAASLITRGTNDVQLVQNVSIMLVRMVLYAPILALGGIVMVMMTNPAMGWVVVVAVVAVFAVVFILFKVAMPKFKIMQTLRHIGKKVCLLPSRWRMGTGWHGEAPTTPAPRPSGQVRPSRHRRPLRPSSSIPSPCRHRGRRPASRRIPRGIRIACSRTKRPP